jgi:hypothetical protein
MPTIWNVNKGYDINNKKLSSKLTFEVGEKFNGKIVDKGEGNEVLVKLADGWQFQAEIEGDYEAQSQGLVKFVVEGFDNGKLKLKVVNGEQQESKLPSDSLSSVMEKEGLSKEDIDLLKSMIKHNIPLTRENISYVKSVLQFSEEINQNSEEIDNFIDKFVAGKGIDPQSSQAKELQSVLRDFLSSFKNLSNKDILLFLENGIEINKENIESFNKLFKSDTTLKQYFDSISNELSNIKENSSFIQSTAKDAVQSANSKNGEINDNASKLNNTNSNRVSLNDSLIATKAYDSNDTVKSKVSIISLLKSMMNTETSLIKEPLKNILASRANMFNFSEYNQAISKLDNISDNTVIEMVKENSVNQKEMTKETLNKVISSIFNKEIDLSDNEFEKTTNMLRIVLEENVHNSDDIQPQMAKNNAKAELNLSNTTPLEANVEGLADDNSDSQLNNQLSNSKANIQGEVLNKEDGINTKGQVILNAELNVEEDGNQSEEVKLQKQNESINDENPKQQASPVNSDERKAIREAISENSNLLKGIIKEDENINNIFEKIQRLSSKDLIKNDIKVKLEDIKDVLKELIDITEKGEMTNSKISELIRGNINDFKFLNSINNEYYYLDLPIENNNKEYPCKLIIKDNRKEGKKIDKTSIKMVVSVKTINLGDVDGFIKVRDLNLDLELKCEEKYIKIFELSKEKLLQGLSGLGYAVNIKVQEKQEDVNLATCRDFFSDGDTMAIDVTV